MPKNLRHIFRSILIRQRKTALRTSRQQIKAAHNGKMTDYRHIYSDNSYRKHWSRAQKFADYCRQNNVKTMDQITPTSAQFKWSTLVLLIHSPPTPKIGGM